MKSKKSVFSILLIVFVISFTGLLANYALAEPTGLPAAPQALTGTAFTYQGRLTDGGGAANGSYDFQFALYDAVGGGSQVGSTTLKASLPVSEGLFTTSLDFGDVFDGTALWLQIAVRPAGSGSYTILSPRQALTAVPYALSLRPGAIVVGQSAGDGLLNLYDTNTAGSSAGLFAQSSADNGRGVVGQAYSATGTNAGG